MQLQRQFQMTLQSVALIQRTRRCVYENAYMRVNGRRYESRHTQVNGKKNKERDARMYYGRADGPNRYRRGN